MVAEFPTVGLLLICGVSVTIAGVIGGMDDALTIVTTCAGIAMVIMAGYIHYM
jgi:hypothetical protein